MSATFTPLVNVENKLDKDKIYARYIPNQDEVHVANQVLENGAEDIRYYDTQIQRFERLLAEARSGKQKTEEICFDYASLKAPIRRLPQELLSEIFQIVMEDMPIAIKSRRALHTHPIFNLGLVCKAWRDLTLEMATFWARFSVELDMLTASTVPALEMFLARSKAAPLEFGLDLPLARRSDTAVDRERATAALRTLLRHSRRWTNAAIYIVPEMIWFLMSDVSDLEFSQLESLLLLPPRPGYLYENELPILSSAGLEKLHSLHTIFEFIPKEPQQWMSTLQVLELQEVCSPVDAHTVLGLCSNVVLVRLAFDFTYFYRFGTSLNLDDLEVLELPELKRLSLTWTGERSVPSETDISLIALARLFDVVEAPSLKSLEINGRGKRLCEVLMEALRAMVLRSECELNVLTLDACVADESILPFLQVLHSLTHLHMTLPFSPDMCKELQIKEGDAASASSSSSTLLPSLRHLDLAMGHMMLPLEGWVHSRKLREHLDMLRSRRVPTLNSGVQPLVSAKIRCLALAELDREMLPLRQIGLKVDVVEAPRRRARFYGGEFGGWPFGDEEMYSDDDGWYSEDDDDDDESEFMHALWGETQEEMQHMMVTAMQSFADGLLHYHASEDEDEDEDEDVSEDF